MTGWIARAVLTLLLLLLAFEYCYPKRLHRMVTLAGLVLVVSAGIWIHWLARG